MRKQAAIEARRSGDSPDSFADHWVDPAVGGLKDGEDIRDWWFRPVEDIATIILDLPTGLGSANIRNVIQERSAFSRVGVKRPANVITDTALAVHDAGNRLRTRGKTRELQPNSTVILMEDGFERPAAYGIHVEIKDGRFDGVSRSVEAELDKAGTGEFRRKPRVIAQAELLRSLDARNRRLLAFSAQ